MTETVDNPYKPTVDIALVEQILANPKWTKRIVICAAQALNSLDFDDTPHCGKEILRHGFINWDEIITQLKAKET